MTEYREPDLHEVRVIIDDGNFLLTVSHGEPRVWRVFDDDTIKVGDRYPSIEQEARGAASISLKLPRLAALFRAVNIYIDDGDARSLADFDEGP